MTDGEAAVAQDRNQSLVEREARHNSGLWQPDTAFVRGEGIFIFDANGKRYYDCMAGIAVASLGHAHPRLVKAIAEQAGRLIICSQSLGNDTRTEFLEELFSVVGPGLTRAFMANSGSEVNEAALKWARAATGRQEFVSARRGFAGRTLGVLSLTWEPKYREPFQPLGTPTRYIEYNNIEELDAAVTDQTAAVLLEPIQGEGGIREASSEFLQAARRITRERGALLIMDEIQTGVGRTGQFLASEAAGIEPDMVTLAKGLAGGVPIGALLMTEEVAAAMPKGGHGTTFGGSPLACAAGLAVLQEIRESGLLRQVHETGNYFRAQLEALGSDAVQRIRGRGLLIGVELNRPAGPVLAAMSRLGVLAINAGSDVVRLLPPLIITREQVDEVVALIGQALAETAA